MWTMDIIKTVVFILMVAYGSTCWAVVCSRHSLLYMHTLPHPPDG